MIILHAAKETDYEKSLKSGYYGDFAIKKDGFIHCSTAEEMLNVANDNLKDIDEPLIVLFIDTEKLKSEIKWEKRGKNGIRFPHVYGLINLDSVIKRSPLFKDELGNFYF